MSTKNEIIAAIQEVADRSGDLQQRIGFGAPGQFVENVAGEQKATGQAWTPLPKIWDTIIEGLANFIDQEGPIDVPQISAPFTYEDAGTPVLIGNVPAGACVESSVVIIETPFGSASITVGDQQAQGRLQAAADNVPDVADEYHVPSNYEYAAETPVYLFLTGSPRIGSGRVIVYF